MRTWADDLRRLCDALGLRKPVILGSSFGGDVGLTSRRCSPITLGGIILANTTGGHWGGPRVIEAFGRLGGPEAAAIIERIYAGDRPRISRLSSTASATRSTAPRRAGLRNPAGSWPG